MCVCDPAGMNVWEGFHTSSMSPPKVSWQMRCYKLMPSAGVSYRHCLALFEMVLQVACGQLFVGCQAKCLWDVGTDF